MPRLAPAMLALLLASAPAWSEGVVGTLHLDGFSFVSFQDLRNLSLPSGSELRFRFAAPRADGSIPFTIRPEDARIEPIALGEGEILHYGLAEAASGTIHKGSDGKAIMEFTAQVAVVLSGSDRAGLATHTVRFTSAEASAPSADGTRTVAVQGVAPQGSFVQLVGAVTNPADHYPEPGKAVYAVLSGTFDALPVPR